MPSSLLQISLELPSSVPGLCCGWKAEQRDAAAGRPRERTSGRTRQRPACDATGRSPATWAWIRGGPIAAPMDRPAVPTQLLGEAGPVRSDLHPSAAPGTREPENRGARAHPQLGSQSPDQRGSVCCFHFGVGFAGWGRRCAGAGSSV